MKAKSRTKGQEPLFLFLKFIIELGEELFYGLTSFTMPIARCLGYSAVIICLLTLHVDQYVFRGLGVELIYPYHPALYIVYVLCLVFSPFVVWAFGQIRLKRQLIGRLTDTFVNSGLTTAIGRLPAFVSDVQLDESARKLTVAANGVPLKSFLSAKDDLEANLNIYIDEVREKRANGLIEVFYSHEPMPKMVPFKGVRNLTNFSFLVGFNRSKIVTGSFRHSPHLLVAGESGGGKSTFLRGLITTLYLNQKNRKLLLVDLKGGLEFQLFEGLPNVTVASSIEQALPNLKKLFSELQKRMGLLKAAGCKDIDEIFKRNMEIKEGADDKTDLSRHVIVIDEAADLFLAGNGASLKQAQEAKAILSEIARKGRAVGFHIVIGTQRPDSRALDPQVKANLSSVVCFQMSNIASSTTALDSKRAYDLPAIAGRAIWKNGRHVEEVQTPFLDYSEAEKLLVPYRKSKETNRATKPASQDVTSHEGLNV